GIGAELRGEVHQLEVIEDGSRAGGEGAGEHGLARPAWAVEQDAARGADPPLAIEVGLGEGGGEAPDGRLGLRDPADVLEGGVGLDRHHHAAAEIAELLSQLGEDVLDAALDRPLLALGLGRERAPRGTGVGRQLVRHGQILGPACGAVAGARSDFSNTRSSTRTGAPARMASAMASGARASSARLPPRATRWRTAKQMSPRRSLITTRVPLTSSRTKTVRKRSCVS